MVVLKSIEFEGCNFALLRVDSAKFLSFGQLIFIALQLLGAVNTMKDRNKYSVSQLLNFVPDSYFERTSRPIYAIVFLLPFIIFYELGTMLINTDLLRQYWQGRVVAFSWLQDFLLRIGLGSKIGWAATPLTVVIILAALQVTSRKKWRFWLGDIIPMAGECILLAVPLIVLSMFLSSSFRQQDDIRQFADSSAHLQANIVLSSSSFENDEFTQTEQNGQGNGKWQGFLANVVTGIGAGIYEELVFRLILIVVLMILFQDVFRFSHKISIILSVLVSAALFSAYHHIVYLDGQFVQSSPFSWPEFGFRTIAGIYFAVLFAIRGFGITAGSHVFYDIIAVFMNTVFNQP